MSLVLNPTCYTKFCTVLDEIGTKCNTFISQKKVIEAWRLKEEFSDAGDQITDTVLMLCEHHYDLVCKNIIDLRMKLFNVKTIENLAEIVSTIDRTRAAILEKPHVKQTMPLKEIPHHKLAAHERERKVAASVPVPKSSRTQVAKPADFGFLTITSLQLMPKEDFKKHLINYIDRLDDAQLKKLEMMVFNLEQTESPSALKFLSNS